MSKPVANRDVFINCPFDPEFLDIFRAIVFAVRACGFTPKTAQDENDGAKVRIEKIQSLIKECDWGIHDLSAVELDGNTNMPRFNMPLELGIAMGAKRLAELGSESSGFSFSKKKLIVMISRHPT